MAIRKVRPEYYIFKGVPRQVFFHISDKNVRLILPEYGVMNKVHVSNLSPCSKEEYLKYHNKNSEPQPTGAIATEVQ